MSGTTGAEEKQKPKFGALKVAAWVASILAGALGGHYQNVIPKTGVAEEPSYFRQRAIQLMDERIAKSELRVDKVEEQMLRRFDRVDDKLDFLIRSIPRSMHERDPKEANVSFAPKDFLFKQGG